MKTEWIEKLKELEIALDTEEQVEIPDGMFTDLMEYIDNSHRFSECRLMSESRFKHSLEIDSMYTDICQKWKIISCPLEVRLSSAECVAHLYLECIACKKSSALHFNCEINFINAMKEIFKHPCRNCDDKTT